MAVSLPTMHGLLKTWLSDRVRIDKWTLEMPSVLATEIDGESYPANTAVQFPPIRVEFERTQFGLYCRAEFHFRIAYRLPKTLAYHELPIGAATAILNNLYYDAVVTPAEISEAIVTLTTPPDGVDIQVSDPQQESKDWILMLSLQFYIEFKAIKADDSEFNPPNTDPPPTPITRLDLGIYRGDINFDVDDPATFDLDRSYSLQLEEDS
jgi:hypothetical protein